MKNTISGNEGRGFMKMIVDADSDKVLGVHLIGPECAEIIQVRLHMEKLLFSSGDINRGFNRHAHQLEAVEGMARKCACMPKGTMGRSLPLLLPTFIYQSMSGLDEAAAAISGKMGSNLSRLFLREISRKNRCVPAA